MTEVVINATLNADRFDVARAVAKAALRASDVNVGRPEIYERTAPSVEVRFADRMIEVIAVPYEETTKVMYRDRLIDETVARGAFEGIQMRAKGWKVNRAHDRERPIGYVHKFKPRDDRGLVAEIGPVKNTRDGDDALELAADGLLGASVGFAVLHPDDEEWTVDRRSRTIRKAWLDHIALTGDPAYPGAKVLAVRTADELPAPVSTPNLDQVRAWLLAERYSSPQP